MVTVEEVAGAEVEEDLNPHFQMEMTRGITMKAVAGTTLEVIEVASEEKAEAVGLAEPMVNLMKTTASRKKEEDQAEVEEEASAQEEAEVVLEEVSEEAEVVLEKVSEEAEVVFEEDIVEKKKHLIKGKTRSRRTWVTVKDQK